MDKIPYYTTLAGAEAAIAAIGALGEKNLEVSSLQEYEQRRRS
jgi:carbamoyl-phosphate synthase large subunit